MRQSPWTLCLLALAACVPELPESPLGDAAVEAFSAFDDAPDLLPGIVGRMDAELAKLDLTASRRDRTFDLPQLSLDDLGGADVTDGIDTKDQVRASMVGLSTYSLDDNVLAQVQENMTCANARSVRCHERVAVSPSDPDAFHQGDATVFRTENTLRIQTSALDFWIQAPVDFRWVDLEDGRRAVVARTWLREPFTNDNGKRTWTQRFGLDLFVEDPKDAGQTRRYYATWLGPSASGIGKAFLEPAVRRGLDDGFTQPDAWLDDGGTCEVSLRECLADSPFSEN